MKDERNILSTDEKARIVFSLVLEINNEITPEREQILFNYDPGIKNITVRSYRGEGEKLERLFGLDFCDSKFSTAEDFSEFLHKITSYAKSRENKKELPGNQTIEATP